MKRLLILLAPLLVGCGERKVVHTWTEHPSIPDVAAALNDSVYILDWSNTIRKVEVADLMFKIGYANGERIIRWDISGDYTDSTCFWTKREADSALCASLKARLDSVCEGGK